MTTIVQEEQDFTAKISNVTPSGKDTKKDLTTVIERLLRREHAARPINNPKSIDTITHSELDTESKPNETVVLQFDKVKTSNCAVFQTVRTETLAQPDEILLPTTNSISTEVNEMHSLQAKNHGTLGPDGRVVHDVDPEKMTCDICKYYIINVFYLRVLKLSLLKLGQSQFDTAKTLRLHIKKYHVTSTFVYPCPACTKTFFKPWAVMQHLSNDHKYV